MRSSPQRAQALAWSSFAASQDGQVSISGFRLPGHDLQAVLGLAPLGRLQHLEQLARLGDPPRHRRGYVEGDSNPFARQASRSVALSGLALAPWVLCLLVSGTWSARRASHSSGPWP